MDLLPPIFIGYSPRRPEPRWQMKNPAVVEIATMSSCALQMPDDWIDHWKHNDLGLYDTEELALSICAPGEPFDLYAYFAIPLLFGEQGAQPLKLRPAPGQIAPDYHSLGYDVVCWDSGESGPMLPAFGCSPLSCNGLAEELKVNRFCLIDTLEAAAALPELFIRQRCEPGPYVIAQVWRKRPDGASATSPVS